MGKIIDGKSIADQILHETRKEVDLLKKQRIIPHLGVILIGNNPASEIYVRRKQQAAEQIGIQFSLFRLPEAIQQKELIKKMKLIESSKKLTGLIVQLPIPEHLYTPEVLNTVNPELDVDCLTDLNFGRLAMGTHLIEPPTAGAVMAILASLKTNLVGKNVCLVGMGALVGKPLALLLINARASVTTTNSATKKLSEKTRAADIIISGVGKAGLIKGSMVQKGAIVIDAGTSFDKQGKYTGDVIVNQVQKVARWVTPTPGGVGPITVAILLRNAVRLAKK
jgi:methylenetetrahydrofolate dehydrogenase (NADP+)/methenyltetrahydrofolate cyclohydrolase